MERLKQRWGIHSTGQFWLIFAVFAMTGSSVARLKEPVFAWLEVGPHHPVWLTTTIYLLFMLPAYQVLLLVWGTIFGQFRFFWEFEKKILRRLGLLRGDAAPN
ncbi:MAG: diacylglyceryl transferase [Candidatus Eremiobacteraeota bacterium]|nr:diacylglyceryl transferase [Candidatus Eremiobacteraeota bacterium]